MIEIPRIALLNISPEQEGLIVPLFDRERFSIRILDQVADISRLSAEEDADFDSLVILAPRESLSTPCILIKEIRSLHSLASTPLVILSLTSRPADVATLYNAGADIVIVPPFEPELIYLQLASLGRQKRWCDALIRDAMRKAAISDPTLAVFNAFPHAILLLDLYGAPSWLNTRARALLGLRTAEVPAEVAEQCISWAFRAEDSPLEAKYFSNVSLLRADGHSQPVSVAAVAALDASGHHFGTIVVIEELSRLHHLKFIISQAHKVRTLFLLLCAAHQRLRIMGSEANSISPLSDIEHALDGELRSVHLGDILTPLLEFLDSAFGSETEIKITLRHDPALAVRASDLFQIVGHMLLYAVEHAGEHGESIIEMGADGKMRIVAEPQVLSLQTVNDNQHPNLTSAQDETQSSLIYLAPTLQEYGLTIQQESRSDRSLHLEITFPILQQE